MYEMVAVKDLYTPNSYTGSSDLDHREDVVATFDSRKKALEYIKKAKLKQPKPHQTFKCNTLLSYYDYAEVHEKQEIIDPPHNPEI